ncbi:MAG: HAMP domain-containing histidine kinase [Actinobacteria bacterium]|nr:HAMP domain-containing histidine kinase [Actinomycetota bacterium]
MSDRSIAIDELAVATMVTDGRHVVAANAAAAALAGRELHDLEGLALDDLFVAPGDVRAAWDGGGGADRPAMVDAWPQESRLQLRRPLGGEVAVAVAARPRSAGGEATMDTVLTMRPVHVDGDGDLSGMEVVSTVSHELRSPLTSVKGYTSLLLSRWSRLSDEQKKTMLEQVHHDADRVTRLVNELLDISRLETGHLQLRFQSVSLPGLAASVVAKVALEYPDLECGLDFPDGFPSVIADPDKVEQVLTNLVENAAKYASPTGMQVSGVVCGDTVSVAVADSGAGIPPADLPHIFTKFYRTDHGRPSGSGLGLWISRGLVEAHGGRLSADSVVDRGSVFRFTLPRDGNGRR